eukprot:7366290-Alexandrium_andersonii.AAC.1
MDGSGGWGRQEPSAASASSPPQEQGAGNHGRNFEPFPCWDGENVQETWMAMRRRIRLWQHDCDIPPEKQGSRLFRALTGKAAVRWTSTTSSTPTACRRSLSSST